MVNKRQCLEERINDTVRITWRCELCSREGCLSYAENLAQRFDRDGNNGFAEIVSRDVFNEHRSCDPDCISKLTINVHQPGDPVPEDEVDDSCDAIARMEWEGGQS